MSIEIKPVEPARPVQPFDSLTIPCATYAGRGDKLTISEMGSTLSVAVHEEGKRAFHHLSGADDIRQLGELLISYAEWLEQVDG